MSIRTTGQPNARTAYKNRLALGAAVAALIIASSAHAQQRSFNVPAQDARTAIPEYARQAGVQISAPTGKLRGVRTQPIQGEMDTRAALAAMIAGTGLEIASNENGMIVLRMAEAPGESIAADAASLGGNRGVGCLHMGTMPFLRGRRAFRRF